MPKDLNRLARKTCLLINTVGPYHLYSTPVVEACAKNGTHYLDAYALISTSPDQTRLTPSSTGESPWVMEIIRKYHDTAKANGAIVRI